jgi:GNAT superfamily N-acetyltransferase
MSYYGRLLEANLVAREHLSLDRVPNVKHPSDSRGWVTHRVVAKIGDEEIGHVSISYIPPHVFDEKLGNTRDFCRIIEGRHNPTKSELGKAAEHQRRFKRFHVGSAHIAYAWVEEPHRRKGIASKMYLEAARWVGEQGLVLAASDLQQPEAKTLWSAFVDDPQVPTTKTEEGRPAIDFT